MTSLSSEIISLNNIPGFSKLVSSPASVRKHLSSTLNIKCLQWNYKNIKEYTILKYDKKMLPKLGYDTMGLLRSVITSSDGRVCCFAPPKSLSERVLLSTFHGNDEKGEGMDNRSSVNNNNEGRLLYNVEEFVDGTMINAFYDTDLDNWQIATRSSVGAEISFYMEKGFKPEDTFSYMFYEVCKEINFDIRSLNKEYVYSFVMQHPSNRIVKPIREKALYLVEVYKINNDDVENQTVCREPGMVYDVVRVNAQLRHPSLFGYNIDTSSFHKIEEIRQVYASQNTRYDIVGIIIKDNRGRRYKFRNQNYDYVKKLRGNNPKLQFQYLHLRKEKLVTQYLMYYPEHAELFDGFQKIIHAYTKAVYENYVSCFIKKEQPITEYPEKYRTIMKDVHRDIYLNRLMHTRERMNLNHVVEYVNNIPEAKLMFLTNYDLRRHTIQETVFSHKEVIDSSGAMPNSIDTKIIDTELAPI